MAKLNTPILLQKLGQALSREREQHQDRRRLMAHRAWTGRVRLITAAMASVDTVEQALEVLVGSLVEDSTYAFSVLLRADTEPVCRGNPLSRTELAEIAERARQWREGPVSVLETDGQVCWLLGGGIRGPDDASASIVVVVGRTERTARYYPPPWDSDVDNLRHLLEIVSHVLASIQLRAQLTAERNSLQVQVAQATSRLRLALEDAQIAREVAESGSRAKSAFLANMSHELRTPLNAIIGYSELLATDNDDPELLEDLSRIRGAGRHLLGLISDILDLSKIEAGRMDVWLSEFEAGSLIQEIAATMTPLVQARHNTLAVDVPDVPVHLYTDETKLRQVAVNLLGNAAKFTEGGRIDLVLSLKGGGISLLVRDTGIGMSQKLLGRLFEPFHQGEGPVEGRQAGTGLGLAISRQFMELLGGTLVARSELGRGSEFEARLPLAGPGPAPDDDRARSTGSSAPFSRVRGEG